MNETIEKAKQTNLCVCMECNWEFETTENDISNIRCPRCHYGNVYIEEEEEWKNQ